MKDEQLDNLFRNALEDLGGVPPQAKDWDKEDVFERIQLGLNGDNTKTRRSFFDLAAAVIVLVTAATYSISFFTKSKVENSIPELVAEISEELLIEDSNDEVLNIQEDNFLQAFQEIQLVSNEAEEVEPVASLTMKPIKFEEQALNEAMGYELLNYDENFTQSEVSGALPEEDSKINMLLPFAKNNGEILSESLQKSSKINMSLPVGVAYTAGSVAPVVSFNSSFNLKENVGSTTQLNLGASAYGLMQQNENNKLEVEPVLFAETSLGLESNQDKFITGHAVGVGYQLNKADIVEGRAVKLNYTLSVKKRLKIAAEALVSEGFSKVQPGIKLTFI